MGKKIFIILVVLVIVGVATIPIWTNRMADRAFEKPTKKSAELVKQALLVKIRLQDYKGARHLAEKAILYFPESRDLPYFIYNAAKCGEQEGKHDVAIYWYEYFSKRFPKHEWTVQAEHKLKTLKGMYTTE
jgi:tetratricopeptide (TPR) repeat protein